MNKLFRKKNTLTKITNILRGEDTVPVKQGQLPQRGNIQKTALLGSKNKKAEIKNSVRGLKAKDEGNVQKAEKEDKWMKIGRKKIRE